MSKIKLPPGFRIVPEDELTELRAQLERAEATVATTREALALAAVWCRYRSNDHYDTCEDNCTKAYRYQEGCPIWLALMRDTLPPVFEEADNQGADNA